MAVVRQFDDVHDFGELAEPYWMRDEARHNLEIGICGRVAREPHAYGDEPPYMAVVLDGERVTGAAIRTPPFNLLVSTRDVESLDALAADVLGRFASLPGVMSDTATAPAFAARWQARAGQAPEVGMPQRIYRLSAQPEIPAVPGALRGASAADRSLLIDWLDAFTAEALPDSPHTDTGEFVDARLRESEQSIFLWEHGGPVSLGGVGGATPNGSRVGPVYTPPELRNRGYASACVATLSRRLLAEGKQFLFLFTDLRNPASNHVYEKLGYEPVCDMQEIRFVPV